MSNDKTTLADVKPGGRVRLGDGWSGWATQYPGKMPKLCGARELAELNHYPEEGQRLIFLSEQPVQAGALVDAARAAIPFVAYAFSEGVTGAEEAGRAIEAALSAQPSPGGQGDALASELLAHAEGLERMAADDRETGLSIEQAIEDGEGYTPDEATDIAAGLQHDAERGEETAALLRKAATAVAARQPVGEPVAYLDLGAGGYMDVGTDLSDEALAELPKGRHMLGIIGTYGVDGYKPAQAVDYQAALLAEERSHSDTMDQRDRCEEVADEMADHIARITGVDIGEHSSANCPWQNAIEAAEEYKPAQAVDLERARDEGHDGAIRYVLGYLNGTGDCGSTAYDKILNACGRERIIRSAVEDGELEFTGLGRWVEMYGTAEDRALIDGKAVGNG